MPLIEVEKIYDDKVMNDIPNTDVIDVIRDELIKDISIYLFTHGLVKCEVLKTNHEDFGPLTKIRCTTRVYHPDA